MPRSCCDEGDILSIDCGAIIEGWHGDAAVTVPIGEVDDESTRLMEVTRRSLEAAIDAGRRGPSPRRRRRRGRGHRRAGRVLGRARVRGSRHRHRDARGSPGPQLRAGGSGHEAQAGPRRRHRADGQRGLGRDRVLDDGWTVVTVDGAAPPTSSTPSPSPTTAPKSSPSHADPLPKNRQKVAICFRSETNRYLSEQDP